MPRPGKKVNGMRATGTVMGCPGRKHCVYGDLCPVEIDATPFHWTACKIELERYEELAEVLRIWILEARARPKIVDPEWIEELSEAFIEKQVFAERFRRYVAGMGLEPHTWEYQDDPIVRRFRRRCEEQCLELRFYLLDLIQLLRIARALHREIPLPGHHQRTDWWEEKLNAEPRKRRKKPSTAKHRSNRRKKESGAKKIYRPHVVKTIIKRRRRSAS